jgi:hypothetical protein
VNNVNLCNEPRLLASAIGMNNKNKFFILDIILFIGINGMFLAWFSERGILLLHVDWLKLFIFGMAVYRLANIVSNEKITRPIREPFVEEVNVKGKSVEQPKSRGFKGAIGDLIYCPSCSGVWVAMLLIYAYALWPEPTFIIALLFALSGVERLISSIVGFVRTEEKVLKK